MELLEYQKQRFSRFTYWFGTLKLETKLKALAMTIIKGKTPVKKLINLNDINYEMSLLYEELLRSKCYTVEEFIEGKINKKVQ